MCGRFTVRPATYEQIPSLSALGLLPNFNVAPTDTVPVLRMEGGERRFAGARWGLIPYWAKDHKIGSKMINARSETVREKPSFREAFRRRRCFIVADGYYEWQKRGKEKQAFHIRRDDDQPFLFFGLWETWRGPKDEPLDEPMQTCTIITTEANELTAPVHDRMPAMCELDAECADAWLNPEFQDYDFLQGLLAPCADKLVTMPVSSYVNKVANNGPECLQAG